MSVIPKYQHLKEKSFIPLQIKKFLMIIKVQK